MEAANESDMQTGRPQRAGLERYKDLYLWMLIPMFVMQAGIFHDYWGDLTENAWAVHVHYWTATLWYIFLVLQPYYAAHGQLARHRTNGIIGMFLAGGVAMTALSALNRDIVNAQLTAEKPGIFGPFVPWFFYGIAAIEPVMMAAFISAVIQSIRHRKSHDDHAWWLISTVFLIMMPALGRGLQALWPIFLDGSDPRVLTLPIYATVAIITTLLFWAARRYGKVNHPATWLVLFVNLVILLFEPLGRWVWLQGAMRAVFRG